jgi:hypothetical protein
MRNNLKGRRKKLCTVGTKSDLKVRRLKVKHHTHTVYYGVLTIHESNTTFPVTTPQSRTMGDKDIYNFSLKVLSMLRLLTKTPTII